MQYSQIQSLCTNQNDCFRNTVIAVVSVHLTGACDAGVAGVSAVETEVGTGLNHSVRGETGRHSVRLMAGR